MWHVRRIQVERTSKWVKERGFAGRRRKGKSRTWWKDQGQGELKYSRTAGWREAAENNKEWKKITDQVVSLLDLQYTLDFLVIFHSTKINPCFCNNLLFVKANKNHVMGRCVGTCMGPCMLVITIYALNVCLITKYFTIVVSNKMCTLKRCKSNDWGW